MLIVPRILCSIPSTRRTARAALRGSVRTPPAERPPRPDHPSLLRRKKTVTLRRRRVLADGQDAAHQLRSGKPRRE